MESSNPYVETNSLTSDSPPMASKSFPWKYIDGYYLRVRLFTRFAEMEGDSVGSEFRWPEPFFLYAPSPNAPFPAPTKGLTKNLFSP